ncbi:hypothetical protein DH2020_015732 [Rehmannia glutinosa]|uniref:Uncharacterized protein n=1 Tax=Rehmannia glutinosa TaxID=99300 RepID=A0ABR0WUB8_REHGL
MENTASSSMETRSKILQQIITWKLRPDLIYHEVKVAWTEAHLSALLDYVLKLEGITRSKFNTYRRETLEWNRNFEPQNPEKVPEMIVAFMQDLLILFEVPKLHELPYHNKNTLNKNELVAAFIDILLQLLYHRTVSTTSFEDRINSLEKELRFLVTILGDTPFIDTAELKQVENLLAEFEAVANDAGILVHSFIFVSRQIFKSIGMDKALDALFKQIECLKANITKFLNLLPFVSSAGMNPKTVSVDSLFIVDSLLYDLEDLMNREDGPFVNVMDQIKTLHQGLMLSQSLLKDINMPPHSEIEELNETVARIRDVAYEAEYLVNSFLVGDVPLWYLTSRLTHVIHKIKLIGTVLQELKSNYNIGAFKVAEDVSCAEISLQAKSTFEVDDITVGFEENTTDILDQLVGGTEHLEIISVIGMAGLGKTTLAKKLYNHPSVDYRFDKRSWCIVSQTYRRKRLLIDILINSISELDKDRILNMEEEVLVEHIYKNLKGRRYLIVMDDIWDSNAWDDLRRCFPDDGNGSRILFTSRNKDVALPNSITNALPSLSNDQCWELLEKKMFHDKPCPPQLLSIGKEIAANCWGLPLAVVVIAGILSTMDKKESTWKNVGERLASYIFSEQNNSVTQILQLSYKHLPKHLKPCFLYFGAFSEDAEISARKLIRLWIAEGFICKEEKKSAESVGEEYLMELIDKSLVIVAKRRWDGGVKACVIHDLLRDLSLKISEQANFLKLVCDDYSMNQKSHRLISLQNSLTQPFGHHVRSIHGYRLESAFYVCSTKLLRVMDFKQINTCARLIGIESLIHLRYLVINDLSASISSLVNLEYLRVQSDDDRIFTDIPLAILKMVKLRYLHITPMAGFQEDCNNSSHTNNLQFLSNVYIYKLEVMEMLKCLPNLRKLNCECDALCVEEEKGSQYQYPDLSFLNQLESLKMTNYYGVKTPKIIINFPSNIKKLNLESLGLSCEKMSITGKLPNLEVLKLAHNAIVGETWETQDGEFQRLRLLKLESIHLTQWNVDSSEHFPSLRRLVLFNCDQLEEIPCEIGEIATLQLIEVQGTCLKSLVESAREIEEEQRAMGNEELRAPGFEPRSPDKNVLCPAILAENNEPDEYFEQPTAE